MSKLTIVIAGETRDYEKALKRADGVTVKFGDGVERESRRAKKSLGGISSAAKLIGGAFVLDKGIDAVRGLAEAAGESEVSQQKLVTQLHTSNISYRAHRDEIDKVIQKTSQLAALDDEDLQDAFTAIVRTTGSVSEAMKGTSIAADVARGKHMDVTKAGEAVAKVMAGNTGILKKLGVSYEPVTRAQDALASSNKKATKEQIDQAKAQDKAASAAGGLAALQQRYAGQASAYGKTSAGAMERLDVASENLKETLGTALAPTFESVSNGAAKFIDEMQTGKGAGGRFADTLGDIADGAKDVYQDIKPIAAAVGKFVDHNPELVKAAGYLVALGLAVKTIKFAGAITGLDNLLRLAGRAGAGPGRAIGARMAGGIADALGDNRGTITTKLQNILRGSGRAAGTSAAASTATSMATGLGNESNTSKVKNAGTGLGKVFGGALRAAGLIGIGLLLDDLAKSVPALAQYSGKDGWKELGKDIKNDFVGKTQAQQLEEALKRAGIRKRAGGRIRAFASGGMVPAFVSPGEEVIHEGRSWTVPGAPVAADSVFTHLPVGAAVMTGHGQALMAAGASLDEAIAMQAPHFAAGGIVNTARAARRAGLSSSRLVLATAIAGPESGYNPKNRLVTSQEDSRGLWQINTYAHPEFDGQNLYDPDVNARAMMRVSGGGRNWQPWTGYTSGGYRSYMDRARQAVIASRSGGTGDVAGTSSGGTAARPARYKNVLGEQFKGSARTAGFEAGLEGARRVSGDLFREIIAGGLAKRTKVADAVAATSGSRMSAGVVRSGGGGVGTATLVGHPEVKEAASRVARTLIDRFPGLQVTSTTGGNHVRNSNHYVGRAVDLAGPQSTMDRAGAWAQTNIASRLLEGIHKTSLAVKRGRIVNGPSVYSSVWDDHRGHIHVAARRGGIIPRFASGGRVQGRAVQRVLDAGDTDSKAATAAFNRLAILLANYGRTSDAALQRLVATSTTRAAAERKAGDKVDARRLDSIADLARAQQGIRLARPIVNTQTVIAGQELRDQRQGLYNRIAGVEDGSTRDLRFNEISLTGQLGDLAQQRTSLKAALEKAKKVKNTKAIEEISGALGDLNDTILDKRASLAELQRALPQRLVADQLAGYTSRLGASSLTEQAARFSIGAADDLDAAGGRRNILSSQAGFLQGAIASANARGDKASADELGQQLLSVRDELHTLDDTMAELRNTIRYEGSERAIAEAKTAQIIAQVDTPGDLSDDLEAMNRELAASTEAYQAAKTASDAAGIERYGNEILGLRGSIESLTQAMQQSTEAMQAQLDFAKDQAAKALRAAAIAQNETNTLGKALSSLVAGELGGKVGLGLQTIGYAGGGVHY